MRTKESIALLLYKILAVLSLVAIAQNAIYWTQLPEQVATHFGVNGQPDAWMSRNAATAVMVVLQLVMPWFFVGIGYILKFTPISLISVPHREYWFDAERKDASLVKMQRFLTAFAGCMSLFIMAINHLTFKANLNGGGLNMTAFGLVLVMFLSGVGIMVINLLRRFQLPRSAPQ